MDPTRTVSSTTATAIREPGSRENSQSSISFDVRNHDLPHLHPRFSDAATDSYWLGESGDPMNVPWDMAFTAEHLIDNEFSKVMNKDQTSGNHKLSAAWAKMLATSPGTIETNSSSGSMDAAMTSALSMGSISEDTNVRFAQSSRLERMRESKMQLDMVRNLFPPSELRSMKPHHRALQRVVKTIFGIDDFSLEIKHSISRLKQTTDPNNSWLTYRLVWLQLLVTRLVHEVFFTTFSFVLTFYALLAPDMVALWGGKEHDKFFLTLNTIIFVLFILELLLMIVANRLDYVLSLPFALDIVAIGGFLSDTWLLQAQKSSGNYGDATRMARLPRLARIARATRLIPRLLALFRRDQSSFAMTIMLRRLRRAFMVMDVESSGYLTPFDLKCLYLSILTECAEMVNPSRILLLAADKPVLTGLSTLRDQHLSFRDVGRIILNTRLGKDMLKYHTREVSDSKGIFSLTTTLTDSAALRICMGILIVVVCMQLLDPQPPQIAVAQGLVHMHHSVMKEHADGGSIAAICMQVGIYAEDFKVLFLYLGGGIYVDSSVHAINECMVNPVFTTISNASHALQLALANSGLRESEVDKVCWPEVDVCDGDATLSMVLVAQRQKVETGLMWSMISTLTVVVVILIFILFFKREIRKWTRQTLHPLRRLVDDMIAISSLELVAIDPDKEWEVEMKRSSQASTLSNILAGRLTDRSSIWLLATRNFFGTGKEGKINKEVQQLQNSFKHMQTAIRSWSRYVPPSVVQRLFTSGVEATVGVTKVPCTILFVDVIGFEDACRGLSPNEVNNVLAGMLAIVAQVVQQNDGTLLEFIGDETVAVFNTPVLIKAHTLAAVTSALQIHRDMKKLPPIRTEDGRTVPLRCRCGVHTANVLAGNIGSHRRMKYGLLGDGVNLSARLKSINSRYGTQTLASDQIFQDELSVRNAVFRPIDLVIVKGKSEPTTLYEVLGFRAPGTGEDIEQVNELVEAANNHSEAYRLYHNRDFTQAKAKFEEASTRLEAINHCTIALNTRDIPSYEMRKRCRRYIRNPPDASWDGVERLLAKTYVVDSDDSSDDERSNISI